MKQIDRPPTNDMTEKVFIKRAIDYQFHGLTNLTPKGYGSSIVMIANQVAEYYEGKLEQVRGQIGTAIFLLMNRKYSTCMQKLVSISEALKSGTMPDKEK